MSLLEKTIKFFTIELLGSNPVFVNVYDNYVDSGILAKDRNYQTLIVEVTSNNVDISNIGDYEILYTIKNSNNYIFGTYVRNVKVVDIISPIINLIGANPLTIEVNTQMPENINETNFYGAIASNNYDNIVDVSFNTDLNINIVGTYVINYYASDSNGNFANASRIINVIDSIPPVVELIRENPIIVNINTPYNDLGLSALDNYDSSLTVIEKTNININKVGI